MKITTLTLSVAAQALLAVGAHATLSLNDQDIPFRATKAPVTISVDDILAGDTTDQPDPATVTLVSVGGAQHGTVTLVDGVVTYTPNTSFAGEDQFDYTATDGTDTSTATAYLYNPFLVGAGSYGAPISDPCVNPVTHQSSGYLTLTMDRSGSFTAKITVAGVLYTLKGAFPANGKPYTGTASHPGKPALRVVIEPYFDSLFPGFNGKVCYTIGDTNYKGKFDTGPSFLKSFDSELAGSYTVLLGHGFTEVGPLDEPSEPSESTYSGYATMRVTTQGRITILGKLSNGRVFQSSTYLQIGDVSVLSSGPGGPFTPYATLPIYSSLRSGHGSIVGSIGVVASGQDIGLPEGKFYLVQGSADWFDVDGLAENSTDSVLDIIGSTYIAPKRGQFPLFAGFGIGSEFDMETTSYFDGSGIDVFGQIGAFPLRGSYSASFNADRSNPKLSIVSSTGGFSGAFIDPRTNKRGTYSGVFLTLPFGGPGGFFPFGVGFYHSGQDSGLVQLFDNLP